MTASTSTSATTAAPRATRSTVFSRTAALAKAEAVQFSRNSTLIFMATVFPLGLGILMFLVTKNSSTSTPGEAAAVALEYFLFFAMMFVQYYTVLSMVTTRRDEGVMKRLRTGEARDGEILAAFAIPGALLTVLFSVVMVVALLVLGAPAPVNLLPVVIAVVLGLGVSTGLALLTSSMTKNAEAAQITSFPVMLLAMASTSSIRQLFPDSVADIIDRTPFALIYDLPRYGWNGAPADAASGATWVMSLILLAWAGLCLWAGVKYVHWDSRQ